MTETKDKESFIKKVLPILKEVVLIVVGILIALLIDAWNQERSNRAEEAVVLENLLSEMVQNQVLLKECVAENESIYSNLGTLLNRFGPDAMSDSTILQAELIALVRLPEYEPRMGVYFSITSSGKLELVQNRELQDEIASWQSRLDESAFTSSLVYDYYVDYIYSYLSVNYSMKDLFVGTDWTESPESKFTSAPTELLKDRVFENHVMMRQLNCKYQLNKQRQIMDVQQSIINRIKAQIGNK
jgi:hypothetical protein